MSKPSDLQRFDAWLKDDGPAAIVIRQPLRPVEGADAPLFPPTFASEKAGEKSRYNIDYTGDMKTIEAVELPGNGKYDIRFGERNDQGSVGTPNVCLVDSVGSQANRVEPAFKTIEGGRLVPQVVIDVEGDKIHLLDAGHRVADAVVRFSGLSDAVGAALLAYRDAGDATSLAKLAPTSLVFGVWDSRATQVKVPRIITMTIRAFDVRELRRSAQYNPPVDYINDGVVDDPGKEKAKKDRYSEEGLLDAPATFTHGGVIASRVQRDATLNLATLRDLRAGDNAESTLALRRYVLGLALVALTHLDGKSLNLRQGCQLVGHGKMAREVVNADGSTTTFDLTAEQAVAYALATAGAFGVGESKTVAFDAKQAKADLAKTSEQAKKDRTAKAARGGRAKKEKP